MELRPIADHIKARRRTYGHSMSIMGESGRQAFESTQCKEEMFCSLGKSAGWDLDPDAQEYIMGPWVEEHIDMDNPTIFYWLTGSLSKKTKVTRAKRVLRVLTLLAKKQNCKAPIVMVDFEKSDSGINRNNNLMAIEVDKFYFNSPLALSGILTMIRAASKTDFVFSTLNNFISKMVSDKNTRAVSDKTHLQYAKAHKILDRFVTRKLPILDLPNREAFKKGRSSSLCYDGIAKHTGLADLYDIELDELANASW